MLPTRRDIVRIALLVVVVRLLLFAWGAIWTAGEVPFGQMWMRWDADHYLTLAREGYAAPQQSADRREFMSRFPPLMPWAIGVVSAALRIDEFPAGILLSIAALFGTSVLLWQLALQLGLGRRAAGRAVVLLNVFPVSYFGNSVFSEPLFMFFLTAYLLQVARDDSPERCSWTLALALLTRTVAVVLYPLHLFDLARRYRSGLSAGRAVLLLVAPVVPLALKELWTGVGLGLAGYQSDHAVNLRITDPIPFLEQFTAIRNLVTNPAELNDTHFVWTELFPTIFILGSVAICAAGWRRMPPYLNAFSLFYLGLLSLLRFNISAPRYCWPLIPLYLILATTRSGVFWSTAALFTAALLYFSSVFVMGRWAF